MRNISWYQQKKNKEANKTDPRGEIFYCSCHEYFSDFPEANHNVYQYWLKDANLIFKLEHKNGASHAGILGDYLVAFLKSYTSHPSPYIVIYDCDDGMLSKTGNITELKETLELIKSLAPINFAELVSLCGFKYEN